MSPRLFARGFLLLEPRFWESKSTLALLLCFEDFEKSHPWRMDLKTNLNAAKARRIHLFKDFTVTQTDRGFYENRFSYLLQQ
jgi:hypothetical protein